jgi:Asp/Glu/hydantoin racemase
VVTTNKKYNNLLATSVGQGIMARIHWRPTFTTPPMIELKQKINEGRDTRLVIEARRRDRTGRHHEDDDSDRFPAFTTSITDKSYPKDPC